MASIGPLVTRMPQLEIVEQPKSRALRFRYATEGDKAGNLQGANSTPEHQTFPAVKLRNCESFAMADVYVSCVTALEPYYAHPHRLVGQDCRNGVCHIQISKLRPDAIIEFTKIGIQCCKQKPTDISSSLGSRPAIAEDPYHAGKLPSGSFDLTTVRLCFQCVLWQNSSRDSCVSLQPIVSNPIVDKKVAGELVICHLSRSSGSVCGGDEVFILCTNVKKDVEVMFMTIDETWCAKGDFSPSDIHKQVAIVFRTPPFHSQTVTEPVIVNIYLNSPSQKEKSLPKPFTYYPENPDPYHINQKRKRKSEVLSNFLADYNIPRLSPAVTSGFSSMFAQSGTPLPPSPFSSCSSTATTAVAATNACRLPMAMLPSQSLISQPSPEQIPALRVTEFAPPITASSPLKRSLAHPALSPAPPSMIMNNPVQASHNSVLPQCWPSGLVRLPQMGPNPTLAAGCPVVGQMNEMRFAVTAVPHRSMPTSYTQPQPPSTGTVIQHSLPNGGVLVSSSTANTNYFNIDNPLLDFSNQTTVSISMPMSNAVVNQTVLEPSATGSYSSAAIGADEDLFKLLDELLDSNYEFTDLPAAANDA